MARRARPSQVNPVFGEHEAWMKAPATARVVPEDLARQGECHPAGLVHGLTRYDRTFAGLVALALMGLCVVSSPGTPLFLGAIGGGTIAALLLHRARARKRPSIVEDESRDEP